MNDADRKARLAALITLQAASIEALKRQQARLEQYHDGRLPANEEKIEQIARGQQELITAARNANELIVGTVKSAETQEAEVDSFLLDLDALSVTLSDPAEWRATVIAADDWRRAAAQIGRQRTISMHWRKPDQTSTEILLMLVELLDKYGFTTTERHDVLTHVRTSSSRGA